MERMSESVRSRLAAGQFGRSPVMSAAVLDSPIIFAAREGSLPDRYPRDAPAMSGIRHFSSGEKISVYLRSLIVRASTYQRASTILRSLHRD